MESMNIAVTSLVLTAVLPISTAVLYAIMARHLQLSPSSAMDSAVVDRFDSETERAAYHADLKAAQEARAAAVMARYRQIMDSELRAMDPRAATAFRQAQALSVGEHSESASDEARAAEPTGGVRFDAIPPTRNGTAISPPATRGSNPLSRSGVQAQRGNGLSA